MNRRPALCNVSPASATIELSTHKRPMQTHSANKQSQDRHHPSLSPPPPLPISLIPSLFISEREMQWENDDLTEDDHLVVELLMQLKQGRPPSPSPRRGHPPPALRLGWSVRQRRSRPATSETPQHIRGAAAAVKSQGDGRRASPSTPLSWSAGISSSGGGGVSETSRRSGPSPPRSKVATALGKRPRRKKTLAELKAEESLLMKERKYLKREVAALRCALEKTKSTNEALKRMKIDLRSKHATTVRNAVKIEAAASSDLVRQRNAVVDASNSDASPEEEVGTPFGLPDLNLPLKDDPGSGTSYEIN